jgi:hypothetical protein
LQTRCRCPAARSQCRSSSRGTSALGLGRGSRITSGLFQTTSTIINSILLSRLQTQKSARRITFPSACHILSNQVRLMLGTNLQECYILQPNSKRSSGVSVPLLPETRSGFRSSWSSTGLRPLASQLSLTSSRSCSLVIFQPSKPRRLRPTTAPLRWRCSRRILS